MGTSEYWGREGQIWKRPKMRPIEASAAVWPRKTVKGGPKQRSTFRPAIGPKKCDSEDRCVGERVPPAGISRARARPCWGQSEGLAPSPSPSLPCNPQFWAPLFSPIIFVPISIQIERLNRGLPHPIFQSPSNIFWKSLRRGRPKKSRRINKMVNEYLFVWSFNIYKYKVQISLQFI